MNPNLRPYRILLRNRSSHHMWWRAAGNRGPKPSESETMTDAAKGRNMSGERKERRGFASMSPEKQREIASKGGRAAHQKGTAHEWTSEEARSAGRKGGQISRGGRGRLVESSGDAETAPAGMSSEIGIDTQQ